MKRRRAVYRRNLRIAAGAISAVAAYGGVVLSEEKEYLLALIPAAIVFAVQWAEGTYGDLLADRRYPTTVRGVLRKLKARLKPVQAHLSDPLAAVATAAGAAEAAVWLRVDLDAPYGEGMEPVLVQVTPGRAGDEDAQWQMQSVRSGIAGRCVRTGTAVTYHAAGGAGETGRLIAEFGLLPGEAAAVGSGSVHAEPLLASGAAFGVLLLRAPGAEAFTGTAMDASRAAARVIAGALEPVSDLR